MKRAMGGRGAKSRHKRWTREECGAKEEHKNAVLRHLNPKT